MTFAATILTLYPEMFPGPLGVSLADDKWSLDTDGHYSLLDVFELCLGMREKDGMKWK